jgi:hypothetical protein
VAGVAEWDGREEKPASFLAYVTAFVGEAVRIRVSGGGDATLAARSLAGI